MGGVQTDTSDGLVGGRSQRPQNGSTDPPSLQVTLAPPSKGTHGSGINLPSQLNRPLNPCYIDGN